MILHSGSICSEKKTCQHLIVLSRRWMTWSGVVQFSPTQKHDLRSISKSVTSLLVGMAVSEGKFSLIDSAVVDCFPDAESTRPSLNAEGFQALYYGYHWFLGRSLLNGHDVGWIAGFGAGGQRLFIVPTFELVVVVNAFNCRSHIPAAILNRFVLPAVASDLHSL